MKKLSRLSMLATLATFLLYFWPLSISAQIPSGYVQTSSTVLQTAKGSFGAAWTNLSTSPQLGLLGCTSTFQQTVNGTIDSYGSFSVLLADTAQICPSPSTWTFTISIPCPNGIPPTEFMLQIPITGGGGTEDISSQITAALPATICQGGGGGGGCNTGLVAGWGQFSDGTGGCLSEYLNDNTTNPGIVTLADRAYASGVSCGPSKAVHCWSLSSDSSCCYFYDRFDLQDPPGVGIGAVGTYGVSYKPQARSVSRLERCTSIARKLDRLRYISKSCPRQFLWISEHLRWRDLP